MLIDTCSDISSRVSLVSSWERVRFFREDRIGLQSGLTQHVSGLRSPRYNRSKTESLSDGVEFVVVIKFDSTVAIVPAAAVRNDSTRSRVRCGVGLDIFPDAKAISEVLLTSGLEQKETGLERLLGRRRVWCCCR